MKNITTEHHKESSFAVKRKHLCFTMVTQSQHTTVLKSYLYIDTHFFSSSVWIHPKRVLHLHMFFLLCKLPDEVWSKNYSTNQPIHCFHVKGQKILCIS